MEWREGRWDPARDGWMDPPAGSAESVVNERVPRLDASAGLHRPFTGRFTARIRGGRARISPAFGTRAGPPAWNAPSSGRGVPRGIGSNRRSPE